MTAASEAGWRSLHPASVVVNLLPVVTQALRSMWPLLVAVAIGGAQGGVAAFELAALGVFVLAPIARTVVHWATLRYRVDRGQLVIRHGLLNRQHRTIPPERIQNVELVRNLFHRLSGLVELRVETASGTEVEGMLSALSTADAEALMGELNAARARVRPSTEDAPAEPPVLLRNGPADLLRLGLTETRFGLALVGLGLVYEGVLGSALVEGESPLTALGLAGAAAGLIALLLGAWLVGAVTVIVRHWDFRLAHDGDRLIASEGLFTRRRVELERRKVQLVGLREPALRRLIGIGSVHIRTAAVRAAGGADSAEARVPVVEADDLAVVLRHAMPDAPADLSTLRFQPPHPRALYRAWVSGALGAVVTASLATWALGPLGMAAWLLVPLDAVTTWLDHRHQGWWVGDRHLISRVGWWSRSTQVVALDKLQSAEVSQGPLARRWDLAALRVRVAGAGVQLPVLAWDDALELQARLIAQSSSLVASRPRGGEHPSPALDHDEHRPAEQHPRDRLTDDAHQQQRDAHDGAPVTAPSVVGPADTADPQPHRHDDQPHDEHRGAGRADDAVEALLPDGPQPRLHHLDGALDREQRSERHQHPGDDDPQA